MAAGSNNYFQIDAKFRGPNNVLMIVNPAKAQQFGSGLTNLALLTAKIKELFYLDDVMPFTANYNGTTYHGFWGLCKVGSANYYMHKTSRALEIHVDKLGASQLTFNDAALNTFGIATNVQITNLVVGSIAFSGDFASSYFNHSTQVGFKYTIKGGAVNTVNKGTLDAKGQVSHTHSLNPLTLIKAGDIVTVYGYVINEEGTFPQANAVIISGTVQPFTTSAMFTTGWPSTASNPTTIWAKESFAFENFYTNAALTNQAPDGYYVFAGKWFQIGTIPGGGSTKGVIAQGEAKAGSWPDGDPANPTVQTKDWYGFSTVSRQAALDNSTTTKIGTMYRKPADGLWYTNYNSGTDVFTGLVPTGFYAAEVGSGLTWGFDNGVLKPPFWNG